MKLLTFMFLCSGFSKSLFIIGVGAVDFNQVVFIILSQYHKLHQQISEENKTILKEDLSRHLFIHTNIRQFKYKLLTNKISCK